MADNAKTNEVKTTDDVVNKTVEMKDPIFVSTRVFVCEDSQNKGLPKMEWITENKAGEILEHPYLRVMVQTQNKNKDGNALSFNLTTFDENLINLFTESKIKAHSNLIINGGIMNKGFNSIRVKSENVHFHSSINYLEEKSKNAQFDFVNVALFGHPVDKGSSLEKGKLNFLVMETDKDNNTITKFVNLNLDERGKDFFGKVLAKDNTFEKLYLNIYGSVLKDGSINLNKFDRDSSLQFLSNVMNAEKEIKPVVQETAKTVANDDRIIDITEMDEIPF